MIDDNDLVEVLDLTFILPVPGKDGEPAMRHYTVREHEGDIVTEQPGALTIQFGARDVKGRRLPGRKATWSSAQLAGMERDVRLEPRVRKTAADYLDPEKAAVERLKNDLLRDDSRVTP